VKHCTERDSLRRRLKVAVEALEHIAETAHGYGSDCHCNGCKARTALAKIREGEK
jgi:hypothetical protein